MMTKKILFLLTFLLLIGGGKLWAATDVIVLDPFTSSEVSANAFSREGSLFTVSVTGCNYLNNSKFQLGDGTQFVITPSNSNVKVLSIGFTNVGTGANDKATCTVNGNSITGNTFLNDKGADNNPKTCTWDNNTDATSFTILFGKIEGNPYAVITSITITYQVMYRGSMPYTWNFHYGGGSNYWPYTTGEMLTSPSTYWQVGSVGEQTGYVTKTPLNNEDLVDGSGNVISETYGLKFTAAAGNIGTALQYELALQGNASVTIPAKAGQKIAVHAYWPAETMTLEHATENTSNASTFMPSPAGDYTYNFTATADNVTLHVNSSMVFIYSIAVTKNDLTGFALNGNDVYKYDNADYNSATKVSIGSLTFDYDAANPYLRLKLNMNENVVVDNAAASYFSITESSNTDVIDITTPGIGASRAAADNRVYLAGVHVLKPGTSTLTFSFAGTDSYNATTCTGTITVNKIAQSIAYPNSIVEISYGGTIDNTLNVTSRPSGNTITYASDNTHVATVATDGTVTALNAGSCTITATLPGSDIYEEASSSYTLTVNTTQPAPTITMIQNPGTEQAKEIDNGATVTTTYGNTVTVRGTCSVNGPTVKYRSGNTSVATVDANGVVTTVNGGTTTITVYTETYLGYPAAEVTYSLTVNPTSFTLAFTPTSGKVNVGKTITPQMTLPTLQFDDILTITASSDRPDIADVPHDLLAQSGSTYPYLEISNGKINRFLPIITGVSEGTTTIRVQFTSHNYNSTTATYTVTVTDAETRNFSWADGNGSPVYTMFKGDYMKIPRITGNSNGNNSYANRSNKKYLYNIVGSKVNWNDKDNYRLYEGVPDFTIVDGETVSNNAEHASIFFGRGQSSSGVPDTLFVFAKKVGTVKIRAIDPQNSSLFCDATLVIVDRASTIDDDASTYISTMKFPYTWNFTGDFDMTDISANHFHWERYDGHYSAGDGFFNVDWADTDNNNNANDRFFKPFVAGAATSGRAGNYMPMFYGLEMSLQSSSFAPKIDRVTINDYDPNNPGAARFFINGGTTQIRLPKVTTQPSSYRIYMKIRTTDNTVVKVDGGSKKYASNTETSEYTDLLDKNSDAIIFFDVTDTSGDEAGSILNFDNTHIYWIACSTEAKNLSYFKHSNSHLTYAAAAYSYPEDLDLSKSNEVNGATAYYASSYRPDHDAQGAYSNDSEQQYAVVMKPLANLGTYVTAGTGMLLRYDNVTGIDVSKKDATIPFYMIANPRNVETYIDAETITGEGVKNYLVGTGANAEQIHGRGTDYTNFMMSAAYKYYTDITNENTAQGDYRFDRDWSFYPVMNSGEVGPQKSYLHIPANLYVDKNGKIVDMPSSSRRTAGESAEAPASKAALAIVFDDELSNGQGTTGISTVATETTVDSDAWYTLQGVRVNAPAKGGIYIYKGKKVVVK